MSAAPITYEWTGEEMRPLPRFHNVANASFVVGERYELEERQARSGVSHRHYFATLHEAWLNLPEEHAERFASQEHLRKWCLIRAGFRDERTFVAASKAEAQRLAAFVKPMDDFAVVRVQDAVVTVYTAKSQSAKAMGAKDFQESKTKVLEILDGMLGVDPGETARHAA